MNAYSKESRMKMLAKKIAILPVALLAVLIVAVGCEKKTADTGSNGTSKTSETEDTHDDHDHAHKAPHDGHLIDLGRNHEYHAELVDDHDNEMVIVYLLDKDVKTMAIEQPNVSLILTANEKTETYELAAKTTGSSSEFTSNDKALLEMLDSAEVDGKLRVTIDGKPFTGSFHHHGHEEHHEH